MVIPSSEVWSFVRIWMLPSVQRLTCAGGVSKILAFRRQQTRRVIQPTYFSVRFTFCAAESAVGFLDLANWFCMNEYTKSLKPRTALKAVGWRARALGATESGLFRLKPAQSPVAQAT